MIPCCQPYLSKLGSRLHRFAVIAHWKHPQGNAHCLVRVYTDYTAQTTVVLLSEIPTNNRITGLMSDLEGLADALWNCIGDEICVSTHEVHWIAHHSEFSGYYEAEAQSFVEIEFHKGYRLTLIRAHQKLSADEVTQMIGIDTLQPVYEVLSELGWTERKV